MNQFEYNRYNLAQIQEKQNEEKVLEFKKRIEGFEKVGSIEEAKELAAKILPTKNPITTFYVGNAKCNVINTEDVFRICLDTNQEFLCYDFT